MGVLWSEQRQRTTVLGPRNIVGRGPEASISLAHRQVSGVHALVTWRPVTGWEIRELGSRNGTWVGTTRLATGETRALSVGDTLHFGSPEEAWTLLDATPPGPVGLREHDRGVVAATNGLLVLPDDERAEVVVFERQPGDWVLEREGVPAPCAPGERLELEGEVWTVLLPNVDSTAPVPTTWSRSVTLRIEAVGLKLLVSQDEEHVDAYLHLGDTERPLRARVHHFLLLALARARLRDGAQGASPGEEGWVYTDDLCRQLQVSLRALNLYVVRIRQQLAAEGVQGSANVIERRALSGQMRLALHRLEVVTR